MTLRSSLVTSVVLALAACGPSGSLSGKVTVEGGSAAGLVVFIYGPESKATPTKDDGSFKADALPDGDYVVRVVVKGADVEEQTARASLKNGKSTGEVALAFKLSAGTVTGHVAFADGSDASGLPVTLTGAVTRGATTGAGGAFSFEGLPPGGYVVAAEAGDTLEGRLAVSVAVSAAADTGELRFSPVGRVAGTVTAGATPVAGASVVVAGTGLVAVTDAAGRFALTGVPTGSRAFTARTDVPPRVAAATATIARGANPDVALALAEETRRGTVTGTVTFLGQQSPRIITVGAPGTAATAQPGPDGAFSLSLPIGEWDVVATAPHYPKKALGHVRVVEGQSVAVPGDTLSWYEPIWSSPGVLTGLSVVAAPPAPSPWAALTVTDTGNVRTLLVNRLTREVRVVAGAAVNFPTFSAQAHYFAWVLSGQLFTYDLTTGALTAWGTYNVGAADPATISLAFSTDESVLFAVRNTPVAPAGYYLERLTLASAQVARFPATSTTSRLMLPNTPDRWLVWDNANEVTLVTPTADYPQLLTQVSRLLVTPAVLAATNCVGAPPSCALKVVAPAGTSALTVPGSWPSAVSAYGTADYPVVYYSTGSAVINVVRSADGALFPAPSTGVATVLDVNPAGTRFHYVTVGGTPTTYSLYEAPLPPGAGLTPIAQSGSSISTRYVSPTRLLAIDWAPAPRLIEVKNGAVSIDPDLLPGGSPGGSDGAFAWQSPAAGKWKLLVGDRPAVTLDVPSSLGVQGGPFGYGVSPVSDFAAITFDASTTLVLDGAQGLVRRSTYGRPQGFSAFGERWAAAPAFQIVRPYSGLAWVTFGTDQLLEPNEPGATVSSTGNGDRTFFAIRDRTLSLAFAR